MSRGLLSRASLPSVIATSGWDGAWASSGAAPALRDFDALQLAEAGYIVDAGDVSPIALAAAKLSAKDATILRGAEISFI